MEKERTKFLLVMVGAKVEQILALTPTLNLHTLGFVLSHLPPSSVFCPFLVGDSIVISEHLRIKLFRLRLAATSSYETLHTGAH